MATWTYPIGNTLFVLLKFPFRCKQLIFCAGELQFNLSVSLLLLFKLLAQARFFAFLVHLAMPIGAKECLASAHAFFVQSLRKREGHAASTTLNFL